jgi:hypothetical protein
MEYVSKEVYQQYVDQYRSGQWSCSAPPVCTGGWSEAAWIAFIFGVKYDETVG